MRSTKCRSYRKTGSSGIIGGIDDAYEELERKKSEELERRTGSSSEKEQSFVKGVALSIT